MSTGTRPPDDFDTPTIIPVRAEGDVRDDPEKQRPSLSDQVVLLCSNAADLLGKPLVRPATAWKAEADRRAAARTDEARDAIRETNRTYLDAMRTLRHDRRAFEKARDEVKWWNVLNGERRAARIVARDSAALAREARDARREARRAYPMTLPALAVRCHAAHLIPTWIWTTVSDSVTSGVAFTGSVAAVALNAATVWFGGRHVATPVADEDLAALQPSQEERELLRRLDPKVWNSVAEGRGLGDALTSGATLTDSGIQVKLTLNGTMDVSALRKKEAQLRAALRLREGTRIELREGKTGGHARLTIRTRSAADGVVLSGWKPGDAWGINTVTGETIGVPLGRRMLIAGTSGSGKSWSARPILAEASEADDQRLVVLDMKRIEARLWKKRARIAITPEEIQNVLTELVAEMFDRLDMIPDGEDTVTISPSLPRITVFVDEGSELISASKKEYASIIEDLRTLARMARAAEIVLVWATQKPLLSGDAPGLDTQVAGQITCRMSLAVATQKEAMVVFGDDAITEGWIAHKLPMPGVAMLRDSNTAQPHHLRMRAMSPKDVMALPERPVWSRRISSTGATVQDIEARKALESSGREDPWSDEPDTATVPLLKTKKSRVSAADRDDQIVSELQADPCRTLSDLARAIGASKSVVKVRLEQMEADGIVRRDEDGCWHPSV